MVSRENNPYRLSTDIAPTNYRLDISPNLDDALFSGIAIIALDVKVSTNEVHFNAIELDLGEITLTDAQGKTQKGHAVYNVDYELASLTLENKLATGPATLEVSFRGILNDQLHGFYRSTFVDADGVKQTIATTQFEATDARRAFPCWDEPTFKATFDVTLNVPSHLAAYSNSPIASETTNPDRTRRVVFSQTMKMSTYLVAFVIGPFEETEPVDVRGTPLRIVVPTGKTHLASFAQEASIFALNFFSTYFDIPYPGDKMDMVAVPDFAFGAMENLGCITYRETALLVDPATASLAELERVATVVAHELAHMWFGDLVTMEWWEGIWLNEAFATFMEVLCTNAFKPEWKMWVSFGIDRDGALQVDGLHSTRPIEYEVVSPADMRGMFDVLTYEKGGSVLRMLEQYLGADVFRDGIRHYLRKHSYANTVTTDLWDALEEISGQPVRDLMNTWILQGGHPLITLADGELSQQPFSYAEAGSESAIGERWMVPVLTRPLTSSVISKQLLSEATLLLDKKEPTVLNAGGSGVYRSRYGSNELKVIAAHINELEELERATLIADGWAALFASQLSWADFWSLVKGLGDQDEPTPWSTIATAVDYANRALRDDQRSILVEAVRELFGPQFERLGWDARPSETERTPQLRAIVIGTLGKLGEREDIRNEALQRFDANDLDGDLARSILRNVATLNRPGDFETFLDRYQNAKNPQEEIRYLYAFASFNDERIALTTAEKCFSEFRNQDSPFVLASLTTNRVTGPAVWRYLTQRWDEALEKFPLNTHARMTSGIQTFMGDRAFADQVMAFHRDNPFEGEQRTVEQNLEKLSVGLHFADTLRSQF